MKQAKSKNPPSGNTGESRKPHLAKTSKQGLLSGDGIEFDKKLIMILSGIVVITLVVYSRALVNGFINWDEVDYIIENPVIRSINFKALFTHYLLGNYHPITELVLAIEYHFWGLTEIGYHAVSLLLHICNSLFVFYLILQLSKKIEIATIASLLFAVHPMHVQSVAWAAELKDLLYGFLFLAALIFYLKYLKDLQKKFYFISLMLFLFSLLSKGMAASLPVVLLLTDYFIGRKITSKTILEKVPFFALAIIFGVISVFAQRYEHALQETPIFPLLDRLVFACYGFIMYLYKLILPLNLSDFYPYPTKTSAGIPSWYYFFPFIFILLVVIVFFSTRYSKKLLFGIGFFMITVFLVLQVLPVGMAIMADRYSYIPSIGICYLAGEGFYWLWNKKYSFSSLRIPSMILLISALVFYSLTTYARCGIWKSGMTLWNDMLGKYDEMSFASKYKDIAFAYNSRGTLFTGQKKYDEAKRDFDKAIALSPGYNKAYINRGAIFLEQKKYDEAERDFNQAIQNDNTYYEAYNSRAVIFLNERKYEQALGDLSKAIELKPDYSSVYNNRGALFAYLKRNQEARADYDRAIALKPDYFEAYDNRGVLSKSENKYDDALADFNKEIELNPNFTDAYNHRGSLLLILNRKQEALSDFNKALALKPGLTDAAKNREGLLTNKKNSDDASNTNEKKTVSNSGSNAYFDRAVVLMNQKNYAEAIVNLDKAISLNLRYSEAYNERAIIYSNQKNYGEAKKDFDKAIEYKSDYDQAYSNRGILLMDEKKYVEAINDFNKVIELQGNSPQSYYNRARAEFSIGKKEDACKDLQQAITLKYQPAEDAFNHLCH